MTCLIRSIGIAAALSLPVFRSRPPTSTAALRTERPSTETSPRPAGTGVEDGGVKPNTVRRGHQSTFKVKREAIDKRIGNKVAADDADRARDAATMAKRNARCQGYVDEAYRQAAWLSHTAWRCSNRHQPKLPSKGASSSPSGCGKWP